MTRPNRQWGTGLEGRRSADLGDGTYRNPVLAGDARYFIYIPVEHVYDGWRYPETG